MSSRWEEIDPHFNGNHTPKQFVAPPSFARFPGNEFGTNLARKLMCALDPG